jgi:hypothetical protein
MSTSDPAFESAVISLLKGIYDNIGSGLPYTSIQGVFRQNTIDDSAEWQLYYNNTGYTFSMLGLTPGEMRFELNDYTGDFEKVCVFIGPSTDYRTIITTDDQTLTNPYRYYIFGMDTKDQTSTNQAFSNYVSFEIRIYP